MLEAYQAFTDFNGMMDLTEDMIRTVAHKVLGTGKVERDGVEIDLDKPFTRISMVGGCPEVRRRGLHPGGDLGAVPAPWPRSTTSSMRSATRRATSSTCSLRRTARTSWCSPPS